MSKNKARMTGPCWCSYFKRLDAIEHGVVFVSVLAVHIPCYGVCLGLYFQYAALVLVEMVQNDVGHLMTKCMTPV